MNTKELEILRGRADAKLRYARVHLEELRALPHISGSDFDQAHQESFLYHLLGAKEALVGELNMYYGCNLLPDSVSLGNLRGVPEASQLRDYEKENSGHWLSIAKLMRDYSTHVGGVPRDYRVYPGQNREGTVSLRHPKERDLVIPGELLSVFADWLDKMASLLECLRRAAIEANKQRLGLG